MAKCFKINLVIDFIRLRKLGSIFSFSREVLICLIFSELVSRKEELDGEIFELLATLGDFLAFKELIMDHKRALQRSDVANNIEISGVKLK